MSEKNLLKKYKSLTPEELAKQMKEKEEAKQKLVQDAVDLEFELENFNRIQDPIVNPLTGKVMCWVKRPTQADMESMFPEEFLPYSTKKLEDIPPEISRKMNNALFDIMARLIVNPKHDALWWKEHATFDFIKLFQTHIQKVFEELGVAATNF